MFSEDNSNRADSGNAFEGDSLSSLTPFGRLTTVFSWMESSRRESTSLHHDVAEGSSRLAGGQEGVKVTSSGRVEASCSDDISSITLEDTNRLAANYRMEVLMPSEQCISHLPPRGYVTVSESFLKFGVQFPLNQFFRDVLRYYSLIVFQVTPNGWAHMIGLFGLFVERNMGPPTPKEFSWFYTLKANKGDQGFYYFAIWLAIHVHRQCSGQPVYVTT